MFTKTVIFSAKKIFKRIQEKPQSFSMNSPIFRRKTPNICHEDIVFTNIIFPQLKNLSALGTMGQPYGNLLIF